MRNGKCPKCGSMNVFTRESGISYNKAIPFYIFVRTGTMPAICEVNSYICTSCGYFENYIQPQDIRGNLILEEISTDPEWKNTDGVD